MAVAFGLLVAVSFGSADFLGGRASVRASTVAVVLIGQSIAVAGALIVASVVGARVARSDVGFGVLSGAANVVGLSLLYRGLARARVGVVAPLTAVVGALVPVTFALVRGERPSAIVLAGAGCAVVAGGLIARERDAGDGERRTAAGVGYAVGAGALLGASLVCLSETSDASGFWPVLAARSAGLVLIGGAAAVLAARGSLPFPMAGARYAAYAAGVLDLLATIMLLLAVRNGLLVVVAPVAALAPAFTVVWAWIVLRESVSPAQIAGLGLALVGLVLVATG